MKDIIFRAKEKDGNWVEGSLVIIKDDDYRVATSDDIDFAYTERSVYDGCMTVVDKETVCQYTGMTDKIGNRIYEGDILVFATDKTESGTCMVAIKHGCNMIDMFKGSEEIELRNAEVIGNVFDNPELIEE